MEIAYLVNQYPYASSTFIRREIAAIEALGGRIARFSIRRPETVLVDQADRDEYELTRYVLNGPVGVLLHVLMVLLARPRRFLATVRTVLQIAWRTDRRLVRHLAYLAEACVILRWCQCGKIEHLHAHFGSNPAQVAMLCHLLGGPTYSFTVHGPSEFDRPESLALGDKIRHAAFVVAVSDFGRSQLYRWCSLDQWPKIRVVHCGVDDPFLAANTHPISSAPRLVCVGRLCGQKGQLLLVQAAARLVAQGQQLQLILVGGGSMQAEIESLVRYHHLETSVKLVGWKDGADVRREILAARAVVLPSFAEGLPLVLMEALALGRPVISTYVAGIAELVEPGGNGWLVPAGNVDALVQAMREVLQAPPQQLQAMGCSGAARVAQQHSAATEAAKLARLFQQSIQGQRPEAAPADVAAQVTTEVAV